MNIDELRGALADADSLEAGAEALANEDLPFDRSVILTPAISMSFISPSSSPQTKTWSNNSGDYYLCAIGYTVWKALPNGTAFRLYDTGLGLGTGASPREFNFVWNMKRRTSQNWYGTNSQGADYLSKTALGNIETGRWLRFRRPWPIPHGDGLMFAAKPTAYSWDLDSRVFAGARFTVNIMLDGFRIGGFT